MMLQVFNMWGVCRVANSLWLKILSVSDAVSAESLCHIWLNILLPRCAISMKYYFTQKTFGPASDLSSETIEMPC